MREEPLPPLIVHWVKNRVSGGEEFRFTGRMIELLLLLYRGQQQKSLLHFRRFVALSVSVQKIRHVFARASLIPARSPPRLNMGSVGYSRSEAPWG